MTDRPLPSVSVVVPTWREAENLPALLTQVRAVRSQNALELELWIMDDDSADGTVEAISRLSLDWVHLVVRTAQRGLSAAVLDGMRRATGEIIVVMDADLSHDPRVIPDLVAAIADGADFAIGSRYAPGGSTDPHWGMLRALNSRAATLLARPFTGTSDPMSGFFAIARERFLAAAARLNPVGYKIGLELIVKCGCGTIVEIPIAFGIRQFGTSKLTLSEQLRYLQHLRRLMIYRYPNRASVLQFALVGASGTVVNLAVVTLSSLAGLGDRIAVAGGIAVSVVGNFLLNRRFTFPGAMDGPVARQFLGFVASSSLGMVVNYVVSVGVRGRLAVPLQLAVCLGIAAGMGLNFVMSRFLVFSRGRAAVPPSRRGRDRASRRAGGGRRDPSAESGTRA